LLGWDSEQSWLTLGSLATRASTTNRGGREQVRARREAAEKNTFSKNLDE
jgi:hypothetical protein